MRHLVLTLALLAPSLAVAQAPPAADGNAYLAEGAKLQREGKLDQAIAAYQKAIDAKFAVPVASYNMACAYARKKDKDRAFELLLKAAQTGFARLEDVEKDPDLEGLRGDPRWATTLRKMDEAAHPCKTKPENRQLDFWVGEWDVKGKQGNPLGASSVQNIIEGCVIYENWTGRLGLSGKSFNFYNQDRKAWQQTWVDSQGGSLQLYGHLDKDVMRYEGEALGPDGKKVLQKLSFTPLPDGRVRQFWETSKDGGKTWNVAFEGFYSRKK